MTQHFNWNIPQIIPLRTIGAKKMRKSQVSEIKPLYFLATVKILSQVHSDQFIEGSNLKKKEGGRAVRDPRNLQNRRIKSKFYVSLKREK